MRCSSNKIKLGACIGYPCRQRKCCDLVRACCRDKMLLAPSSSGLQDKQVFIVAPHFNSVLTLRNNTTFKLRGKTKKARKFDLLNCFSSEIIFPAVSRTLTCISEAAIASRRCLSATTIGSLKIRLTKQLQLRTGSRSDHASFCTRSVGHVMDQRSEHAPQRVITSHSIKCVNQNTFSPFYLNSTNKL